MAFCTKCGQPIAINEAFCKKCGASVNFKPQKKKKSKAFFIMSFIIIAAITSVLAIPKLTDPVAAFKKNLEADNYSKAQNIYTEKLLGNSRNESDIHEFLLNRITDLVRDFKEGSIEYNLVKIKLNTIKQLDLIDSVITDDANQKIEQMHRSHNNYLAALKFIDGKDYVSAKPLLESVMEEDRNYVDARNKLQETINLYKNDVLMKATDHIKKNEYEKAISVLKNALNVIPGDQVIVSEIEKAEAAELEFRIHTELTTVETLVAEGKYLQAINQLNILADRYEEKMLAKFERIFDSMIKCLAGVINNIIISFNENKYNLAKENFSELFKLTEVFEEIIDKYIDKYYDDVEENGMTTFQENTMTTVNNLFTFLDEKISHVLSLFDNQKVEEAQELLRAIFFLYPQEETFFDSDFMDFQLLPIIDHIETLIEKQQVQKAKELAKLAYDVCMEFLSKDDEYYINQMFGRYLPVKMADMPKLSVQTGRDGDGNTWVYRDTFTTVTGEEYKDCFVNRSGVPSYAALKSTFSIVFDTDSDFVLFTAEIGIGRNAATETKKAVGVISIYADDKQVFYSDNIYSDMSETIKLEIDLTNVKKFRISGHGFNIREGVALLTPLFHAY